MAERRMFARSVVGSARFLKMPATSRLLYYDLGMDADDDGVVEAFGVIRKTGATEDDLRVLVSKNFVKVLNEDLVSYIADWKQNNFIRPDRYKPSVHQELLLRLCDGIPSDNQVTANGIPMVVEWYTQDSIGKGSINQGSLMDWKKIVIETLGDHGPRKCATEGIPIELHLIDCEIEITRKAVANGLPAEAVEDIQLFRIMMKRELEWTLIQAKQRVAEVEKALNMLDPTEHDILDKLYIQTETISISRLSKEMCMAVPTMYRKRDAALRKFAFAMYGRIKS